MLKCVLDSSAVIALIAQEHGSEFLSQRIQHAVISSINYAEVVSILARKMPIDVIQTVLSNIITEVIAFEKEDAIKCGLLYNITKQYGLSIGDRACITLGQKLNLTIYTADKIWAKAKLDAEIVVIR